jgi:hypothetical protein
MFYVLFMCKCVLPPGVNPVPVDKYIKNIPVSVFSVTVRQKCMSAAMYICYKLNVRKYRIHMQNMTSSSKMAHIYEGESLNNRNFIIPFLQEYLQKLFVPYFST